MRAKSKSQKISDESQNPNPERYQMRAGNPENYQMRTAGNSKYYQMREGNPEKYQMKLENPKKYQMRASLAGCSSPILTGNSQGVKKCNSVSF